MTGQAGGRSSGSGQDGDQSEGTGDTIGTRRGSFGGTGTGDTSGYGRLVQPITLPGSSSRPYGGYFDEIVDRVAALLGAGQAGGRSSSDRFDDAIESVVVYRGAMTFHVRRDWLVEVARTLRDDPELRFELSLGVSGVHYPDESGRELHAVYPLRSISNGRMVSLEVAVAESDPHIPSLTDVYPTCDWHERETYDFFGIVFDGHPALTRIEMPDDWDGHPQRKDYPLGGIPVEYHGATIAPPDQRRSYH